jgi:hypothetical protein
MPTEVFEIADSTDADYNLGVGGERVKVGPFDSETSRPMLDAIRDALVDAGWSEQTGTPAQAGFVLPFGAPTYIPAVPPVGSPPVTTNLPTVTIDGLKFVMYDPTRQTAGTDPDTIYLHMGTSAAQAMTNLVDAIDLHSDFTVTAQTFDAIAGYTITIAAKIPGTLYNGSDFHGGIGLLIGRPFWSTPTTQPRLGGWVLRSTLDNGEWLEVWMYGGTHLNRPAFEFRCSTGGATPTLELDQMTSTPDVGYSILANQFQFLIFQDQRAQAGGSVSRTIFATQAYVKPGKGCDYSAVIAQTTRETLQFGGPGWSVARDGELSTLIAANYNGAYPGFYCLGSPSAELVTSHGYNLITNGYIGSPEGIAADASGQARIVGLAWDAIAMNRNAPLDSTMLYRGLVWHCAFSQNGSAGRTPASVWFAFAVDPTA